MFCFKLINRYIGYIEYFFFQINYTCCDKNKKNNLFLDKISRQTVNYYSEKINFKREN